MDDALSIKSIFRALKNRQPVTASLLGSLQPLTFHRLIQVQVCIVYLYAALHKLNMGYLSGLVLNYYLVAFSSSGRSGMVFQALLALWFSKTKPIAIILGIGFHPGILLGMGILNFSLAMMAT